MRFLLLAASAAGCAWIAGAQADRADQGRRIFEKRCTGCHALDSAKEGPPLRGVFGRRAGSDPRFPYSDALRKAAFVWDQDRLNRWLADPDALAPDNNMPFRLDNAAERAVIVEYLKSLPAKPPDRPPA